MDVTFASSLGGQQIVKCGGAARSLCAQVGTPAGYGGAVGRAIAADCRKLKLHVG